MPRGSIVAKWLLTLLALFLDVCAEKTTHTYHSRPTNINLLNTHKQLHPCKDAHTNTGMQTETFGLMFWILAFSDGKLNGKCDAPVSLEEGRWQSLCSPSFTCICLLYMCFSLTLLTWTSEGLREKDCQGTESTQKEHNFGCVALLHLAVFIISCVSTQNIWACMYVCVSFSAWWLALKPHKHRKNICLGSQCVSIWVWLELCHVTYSLLGATHIFASGWTHPRQALDLTWAMFSGTPSWLILTELFGF